MRRMLAVFLACLVAGVVVGSAVAKPDEDERRGHGPCDNPGNSREHAAPCRDSDGDGTPDNKDKDDRPPARTGGGERPSKSSPAPAAGRPAGPSCRDAVVASSRQGDEDGSVSKIVHEGVEPLVRSVYVHGFGDLVDGTVSASADVSADAMHEANCAAVVPAEDVRIEIHP